MCDVFGVQTRLMGGPDVLAIVGTAAATRKRALVLSGNARFANLCRRDPDLRRLVRERAAGLRVDGAGIQLACRLAGVQCPPRCTWADFAWPFGAFCAAAKLRVFLLGGTAGTAAAAAARWRERVPGLLLAGARDGFFDKRPTGGENRAVLDTVAAAGPDVLLVGFGMPLQERWIDENWTDLDVPAILTVGAAFDYLSGRLRRPPSWMQRVGLEWLGRWAIEPRRLTGRYTADVPVFLAYACAAAARQRLRRTRDERR